MSRWIKKTDGWHRDHRTRTKGSAHYFERPLPPVLDAKTGHPIGPDGKVDWARVIRESNEKHGT